MCTTLEQRLQGTGSLTPAAHVNAGCSQSVQTPANEDAVTAGVK